MSTPEVPLQAVELKPVMVYRDAAGNNYRRLLTAEAAQTDGATRGYVTTTSKKNGESKKFNFYAAI